MAIRIQCSCGKTLRAATASAGRRVKCPHCGSPVHIPAASAAQAVAAVLPAPAPRTATGTEARHRAGGRRWLIVGGAAGAAFLSVVLVGMVLWVGGLFSGGRRDETPPAPVADGPPGALEPAGVARPGVGKRDDAKPGITKAAVALPPMGPPRQADPVAAQFKTARATYLEARQAALKKLNGLTSDTLKQQQAAIQQSKLKPAEKKKALEQLAKLWPEDRNANAFLQGPMADYRKEVKAAANRFAKVADEGLAVYKNTGVVDPTRLRPLRAARTAAQHCDLLGVWTCSVATTDSRGMTRRILSSSWLIDFDQRTGGLQVAGGDSGASFRGENVEFKNGVLSFVAVRSQWGFCAPRPLTLEPLLVSGLAAFGTMELDIGYYGSGSVPMSMTLEGGTLRYELRVVPGKPGTKAPPANPIVRRLIQTDSEKLRTSIIHGRNVLGDYAFDHVASGFPDTLDVTDVNAVWRQLAAVSSFGYYQKGLEKLDALGQGALPSLNEQVYLPYRQHFPYPNLPGIPDPTRKLLADFEAVAACPHPYLQQATDEALAICQNRIRLAMADDLLGNTPDSSIRVFQRDVLGPAVQYALLKEEDRLILQHGQYILIRASESAERQRMFKEFLAGAGNFEEAIKKRAVVSGLLAYADMVQAERNAAFWQTWLLPLVKRSSGPAAAQPLVEIRGDWREYRVEGKGTCKRLDYFFLRNISGQNLTHVVVSLLAENEWGERAAHYYYFTELDTKEVELVVDPRWKNRRLPFTSSLTVTSDVWAEQGSCLGQATKLTSPAPYPDVEGARQSFLDQDGLYQAEGEAFGVMAQRLFLRPGDPAWLKRGLRAAAAPGKSYVFNVTSQSKSSRTLVLRFLRCAEGPGGVEAEVLDAKSRQPFLANTPVWKGQLHPGSEVKIGFFGTAAVDFYPDWTFGFGNDDSLMIHCPNTGMLPAEFPVRDIPVFAVKTP